MCRTQSLAMPTFIHIWTCKRNRKVETEQDEEEEEEYDYENKQRKIKGQA